MLYTNYGNGGNSEKMCFKKINSFFFQIYFERLVSQAQSIYDATKWQRENVRVIRGVLNA